MSTFVLHRLVTVGGDFDIERARAAAHAVIATLPRDQLRTTVGTDEPDTDDAALRREAIQLADAELDAFANSIEHGDVDTIDLGPLVIYISAGISHGDAATDAAAAWEQLLDTKPWSPAVREALGVLDPATVPVTLRDIPGDAIHPVHTLNVVVPDDAWTPAHDADERRLHVPGGITINGVSLHLDAIQVNDEPAGDAYVQEAADAEDQDFDTLSRLANDGPLHTCVIGSRPYVLVAYPYAN